MEVIKEPCPPQLPKAEFYEFEDSSLFGLLKPFPDVRGDSVTVTSSTFAGTRPHRLLASLSTGRNASFPNCDAALRNSARQCSTVLNRLLEEAVHRLKFVIRQHQPKCRPQFVEWALIVPLGLCVDPDSEMMVEIQIVPATLPSSLMPRRFGGGHSQ